MRRLVFLARAFSFDNRDALLGGSLSSEELSCQIPLSQSRDQVLTPTLFLRTEAPHLATHWRHATAMHLLQAGVDLTVIALWLGHESTATTHRYVEADLAMKERALNALQPPSVRAQRFRPTEGILAFLEGL